MKDNGLRVLPKWPAHSPDLNPAENMWGWTEAKLLRVEKKTDSLPVFKRRVVEICKKYPLPAKLAPALAERIRICVERKGGHTGK